VTAFEADGGSRRCGCGAIHRDGAWPPVVALGADRESGTLRTVPGRISDGSAPMASELARYRAGQSCAICAGAEPVGRR